MLSQNRSTLVRFNPKSLSCCFNQRICSQHLPAIVYSASEVDNATQASFLFCHGTRLDPRKWQVPLVLFLSNLY